MNKTEDILNSINTNIFFKEFTFGFDNLIRDENNQQIELADNIVWLENYCSIYQIKERNTEEKSVPFDKWLSNKVINKAANQIKNTIKTLKSNHAIIIKNNRNHARSLKDIPLDILKKIIIYNPNEEIENKHRFLKFRESKTVGLIHLFHIEDYMWVCKYLATPYEVYEYLEFREKFYQFQGIKLNQLPEQYILSHYFAGGDYDSIDARYIDVLNDLSKENESSGLNFYLSKFGDRVKNSVHENDYYLVLAEIAKLHRNEMTEFKKRFLKIFDFVKTDELHDPYRMTVKNGCGFVFWGLTKDVSENWENALINISLGHKYEQKINKCVGVVVFQSDEQYDVFWTYIEKDWEYEEEMENYIKTAPLRELKKKSFVPYKFKLD